MRKLKVAIIAPLWEQVPPRGYGGIERYIYDLLEEFAKLEFLEVTIYCSDDSKIPKGIRKVSICPSALRTDSLVKNPQAYYSLMMGRVFREADRFDIIHNHTDHNALPFAQFIRTPLVTHLHSPLIPERIKIYKEYSPITYFVSISLSQQKKCPNLNYVANIYHGVPVEKFPFNNEPSENLVWIGRICQEKDTRGAIEVARATGRKLILAGKIDPVDWDYYEIEVRPFIDEKQIFYIGELGFEDKVNFLKAGYCLLMPLTWEEPFGLVLIESMACGTPVIATGRGSIPEIVRDKKTGFIVNSISEMVKRVAEIPKIKRRDCRLHIEKNFHIQKTVSEHIEMYEKVITLHKKRSKNL